MKITDSTIILAEIDSQLQQQDYTMPHIVGLEKTRLFLLQWYMTADSVKANGMDFQVLSPSTAILTKLSMIWTIRKLSTILDEHATRYTDQRQILYYNDLATDVQRMLHLAELNLQLLWD